jgi:hypothetical protein
MSQKEFQRVKVIENAAGGSAAGARWRNPERSEGSCIGCNLVSPAPTRKMFPEGQHGEPANPIPIENPNHEGSGLGSTISLSSYESIPRSQLRPQDYFGLHCGSLKRTIPD